MVRINHVTAKPFLKWVGGKSQLLEIIRENYPSELKNNQIEQYIEPFVGGGAVLFDILSNYSLKKVIINDMNKELINTYKVIQIDVCNLIELLLVLQQEFIEKDTEDRKVYFYQKRNDFNEIDLKDNEQNLYKAALFIFLNKTCFNGLYRVNKKGKFNVPMGSYKNPKICDVDNLKNVSVLLKNVDIYNGSYEQCLSQVDDKTLVYCDPPYRPLNVSSSFTSYTENGFDDDKQKELAQFVKEINNRHAKFLLSNSDPKNINEDDDFFDELYQEFNIVRVKAKRMINSKATKRGNITEILVNNFTEDIS